METIGFTNTTAAQEYAQVKDRVMESLKEYFKPEFLNRLDEVVIFDVLSKEEIKQIVSLQIEEISKRLAQKDIVLEISDEAVTFIAEKSFDPHFGARPVKRYLQSNILNKVAQLMLSKKFQKGGTAEVKVSKGELAVDAKKGGSSIPNLLTKNVVFKK